jgi:hypothetical protein
LDAALVNGVAAAALVGLALYLLAVGLRRLREADDGAVGVVGPGGGG